MRHRSLHCQHRPGRRVTVVALAVTVAMLVAACGTGDQASPGGADDANAEAATRTVTHALGTTEIPAEPQRIVALWGPTLSALLTLGEEPVAAVEQGYVEGVDVPEGYDLDQLVLTGSSREPDLELVATVEPDLIIGIENFAGERYDELSQIAPTVLLEWDGSGAWQQHLDEVADALGLDDERDDVVADYDQRVSDVRQAVGEPSDIEVSIVRFQGDGVRLEGRASSAGVVVDDVGLARPPSQDFADEGFRAVSLERLSDADSDGDGDVLFYWANDEEGEELVERARENPLWTSLEVVRNDAAHTVDGEVWGTASYLAAYQVLDKIEAVLGGEES